MTTSHSDSWVDEVALVTLDRSDIEPWGECPCQAWLKKRTPINDKSIPLVVGIEAHDAISRALRMYLDDPQIGPAELKGALETEALVSRPDVQPLVINALRAMSWNWARFITERSPSDILRYDGGEAEHSGQLAVDFPEYGVRLTTEVDLLYVGHSPEVLHEIDYKSGWKKHTLDGIANSFQFQCHSLCVFENYPDVQVLGVRVWPSRESKPTPEVMFYRDRSDQYNARIAMALQQWVRSQARPSETPPTWPESDKCRLCPVSHLCPLQECQPVDPVAQLEKLIVIEQAEAALRKSLIAAAKRTGADIVTVRGDKFHKPPPKSTGTWKVTKSETAEETESEDSADN